MPTESKRHPTRHDAHRPGWSDDRPRRKQDHPRGRGRPPGPRPRRPDPRTAEALTRTMARVYVPALVQAGAEVARDREQVARLAYSRSVTHPDVLDASVGISAEDAEAARRAGAALGWSDVGAGAFPITSAPVSHRPGRSSRRPDDFVPSLGRRVHGYV